MNESICFNLQNYHNTNAIRVYEKEAEPKTIFL